MINRRVSLVYWVFLECIPSYGLYMHLTECLCCVSRHYCTGWLTISTNMKTLTCFNDPTDHWVFLILALVAVEGWIALLQIFSLNKQLFCDCANLWCKCKNAIAQACSNFHNFSGCVMLSSFLKHFNVILFQGEILPAAQVDLIAVEI